MIKFIRNQTDVEAKVDIQTPDYGTRVYTLPFGMTDALKASFVAKALRDQMFDKLAAIRREAYKQGWKDARGKRQPKEDWLSGRWPE